jgi:hypothetical protein
MRTLRLSLIAAIVLILPVGFGPPALGQSEEPRDPMGANYWTGTWAGTGGEAGEVASGPGYSEALGVVTRGEVAADDTRIAGTMTQVHNLREAASVDPAEGAVGIISGTVRIDNDEGAWVGTFTAYGGEPGGKEWYVMEGEGAYEGLTTIFGYGEGSSLEGVILPAELPAQPDPVAPPSEE